MSEFTLEDFVRIAKVAAGEDGMVELDLTIGAQSFDDLDLDSLSVVAIVTAIEAEADVRLPDGIGGNWTPDDLVEMVQSAQLVGRL